MGLSKSKTARQRPAGRRNIIQMMRDQFRMMLRMFRM